MTECTPGAVSIDMGEFLRQWLYGYLGIKCSKTLLVKKKKLVIHPMSI